MDLVLSKFSSVVMGLKKAWQGVKLPLPLLFVFFLPFYGLPEGREAMRLIHIQYFQLAAILAYLFSKQENSGSSYLHPFRWFVVLALSQLVYHSVHGRMLFFIQMITICYLFFEVSVRTKIKFVYLQSALAILVLVTCVFAVVQYFDLRGVLPDYLMTDFNRITNQLYVSGIWYKQAYCGAFAAMCVPVFLVFRTRLKWIFITACLLLIHSTNSSAAWGGALLGVLWYVYHRRRNIFKWVVFILPVAFLVWYILPVGHGNWSSELSRIQVWELTLKKALEVPLRGLSLGSFYHFGFKETLMAIEPKGVFYAEAHNEFLQMFFEAGIPGVIVALWFNAWVIWYGYKFHEIDSMLGLSGSLLALLAISNIQPVFHVINLSSIAILMLAMMEQKRIELEGEQ